ncbi:hypothetical protein Tco_0847765 [Tanacetum coccineum]
MSEQMINHVNSQEKANKEPNNESVTAELERYKERVKTFEQRLNIDLSNREKMIDSQMDDMIKEKLALKEQVDSLEKNLSKQIKEKECLLQTFSVFKNESKEKENKYMENEIDLEKKIKELDNIIFKVGYQNPFYLKKAQRIKPTLYDGIVMSAKHVAMPVIDDEETLILEEESRSKMSKKEKDPEAIKQNISHKPIDYEKLNRLSDDFGKRKPFDASLVKIEAPKELPKNLSAPRLLHNREAHIDYLKYTQEQADILWEIVEQAKAKQPLDSALDFALPPKKTSSHSFETQKPELKVYSRKPKNVKNVGSSKKAKTVVPLKNANHSEPNNAWGSNATNIPSSSSIVMTGCPDCSLVSGLWIFKTYDREPLSSHEQC